MALIQGPPGTGKCSPKKLRICSRHETFAKVYIYSYQASQAAQLELPEEDANPRLKQE
jgi:hypothetical protein